MKIKALLVTVNLLLTTIFMQMAAINPAFACGNSKAAQEVLTSVGTDDTKDCGTDVVSNVFKQAITILSLLIGGVGVIMIMVGGFRYITSGGDSGRVSNAKATLMYALIGLAVAALAQFLIHFVLFQASKVG